MLGLGWGIGARVRERLVVGVREGVGACGRRACASAYAACEPSRVQGAVMGACLNVCGLKVKVNVGA